MEMGQLFAQCFAGNDSETKNHEVSFGRKMCGRNHLRIIRLKRIMDGVHCAHMDEEKYPAVTHELINGNYAHLCIHFGILFTHYCLESINFKLPLQADIFVSLPVQLQVVAIFFFFVLIYSLCRILLAIHVLLQS